MIRAASTPATFGPPLGEMNTTPLIDVMLVLLVMFILAVPAAVNQVPIDLPVPSTIDTHPELLRQNDLTVAANGQLGWNGAPLGEAELFAVLQRAARTSPESLVRFRPAGAAPYGSSARILRLIKLVGITNFAFIGNEQYAAFGKAALLPALR